MTAPRSFAAGPGEAHLRVLSTTDLHGHVTAYDYFTDTPGAGCGLAAVATVIRAARAEAANALLVDCGDFLQGNPMGDLCAAEPARLRDAPHPIIAAMNRVGIEASVLGNHDFNYGLAFLDAAVKGAAFPVVTANVTRGRLGATPAQDELLVPPYVILDRVLTDGAGVARPIRIGLIGFCPPQIMNWDGRHLTGRADARDMVEAAAEWVPRMKEAGADIVVALAHTGIDPGPRIKGMEHAALHLAQVAGIDALVCGHQHRVFPGPDFSAGSVVDLRNGRLAGKPACMAGFWGGRLGVIDLMLEDGPNGWRVVTGTGTTRKVAGAIDDPAIVAGAADAHRATLAHVRRPVGETAVPLRTWFALVADTPALGVVAEAQALFAADALSGSEWTGLPILSVTAPFKAGGHAGPDHYTDIPAGPLAIKDISDLYLYPNALCALLLDGRGVQDWLERSAAAFNVIAPGASDVPLVDPDFQTYNFDVISGGLSWQVDLARPRRYGPDGQLLDPQASRIIHLRHRCAPVAPGTRFVVVTNSYRASGGGNFPAAISAPRIFESPENSRDILMRHVAGARVAPPREQRWRFAPMPGTSVIFASSPAAAAFLDEEVPGLDIAPAGQGANGFGLYRIKL